MDFLSNLATIVFILIFMLLVAHPRIILEPYVDVFLWAGIMSFLNGVCRHERIKAL